MLLVSLVTAQVESVSEQRISRVVSSELLLEDVEVVYVVEYPVEVGGEETGLDHLGHLGVALPIQVEHFVRVDGLEDLRFLGWVAAEDLLDIFNVSEHSKVRVNSTFLQ